MSNKMQKWLGIVCAKIPNYPKEQKKEAEKNMAILTINLSTSERLYVTHENYFLSIKYNCIYKMESFVEYFHYDCYFGKEYKITSKTVMFCSFRLFYC